jgi:hypothetical protein
VLGLAAFAWVVAGPLASALRIVRYGGGSVALGVGLAIVAFLLHGLLDTFLAFNPTAWLFWLLLGVAAALALRVPHHDQHAGKALGANDST